MTIFSRFQVEIIKHNLGKNLAGKCVVHHLLVPYQSRVIIIMKQAKGGKSSLTFMVLKLIKLHVKNIHTVIRQMKNSSESFKRDVNFNIFNTRSDHIIGRSGRSSKWTSEWHVICLLGYPISSEMQLCWLFQEWLTYSHSWWSLSVSSCYGSSFRSVDRSLWSVRDVSSDYRSSSRSSFSARHELHWRGRCLSSQPFWCWQKIRDKEDRRMLVILALAVFGFFKYF